MAELYRELVRILRANGCYLARAGKGSHEIWYSPGSNRNVTVPRSSQIPPHRQRHAQAGRPCEGFLK